MRVCPPVGRFASAISHRLATNKPHVSRAGRTPLATLLAITLVGALAIPLAAEDSGDPPSPDTPRINHFTVDTIPNDYGVVYRFWGFLENCENISSPVVVLVGSPFDATVNVDSLGFFEIEFGFSGTEGTDTIVAAYIEDNGTRISDYFYVST